MPRIPASLIVMLLLVVACAPTRTPEAPPERSAFSEADAALLDEIQRACFNYFWNEADPATGLCYDKTGVEIASVAGVGFDLAALPIGVERGYVTREEAEARALKILRTLRDSPAHRHGIFSHFIDPATGGPSLEHYETVASTIDTALLAGGLVVAGEYFGGEAKTIADALMRRMDWKAFEHPEKGQVYMAWEPEDPGQMDGPGHFHEQTWDFYTDEALLIALLGIAQPEPSRRLPSGALTAWKRPTGRLGELEYVYSWPGTLFTYTFAHCFIDFTRLGPDPAGRDWFFNTAMAVRANRDWCRAEADNFDSFGLDRWGITACSGPGDSYVVPGHQPRGAAGNYAAGGTLAPYGAGMALPFAPDDALAALRHMRGLEVAGKPVWQDPAQGGYGFADAFNIDAGWVSDEVLAIAHGPMLLCIENARTGLVQELFMADASVAAGLERAGFGPRLPLYPELAPADAAYLRELAEATWRCIAQFTHPETGLPYDLSSGPGQSSVTNLGYYAACAAVAHEMGMIDRAEAERRVRAVLDAYEKFPKWKGWSQSWHDVATLEPSTEDPMVSVLDSANLYAGLALAGRCLPRLAPRIEALLDAVDWSAVYDPEAGLLYGGYNMRTGELARDWHIGDYAGDGRMAAFWAIGEGVAPPGSWQRLQRERRSLFGLEVLEPDWRGGGLFMQVQDGLFLEESCRPIGRSAANFAYAQMLYAERLGLPAWGWSACWAPDGERYLGWDGLEAAVVTPHAVALAAMHYPAKATACLRRLEALGARPPYEMDGKALDFGFRDSIDLETGAVSDLYLPALDQAMLFLALANVLDEGIVQRRFAGHPTVRKATGRIDEYGWPLDQGWLAELRRRDREPLPEPAVGRATGPAPILVDDFEDADPFGNRLGGVVEVWLRDAESREARIELALEAVDGGQALRADYDLEAPQPEYGGLHFGLAGIDGSGCDTIAFRARGDIGRLKVELHGEGGGGAHVVEGITPEAWRDYRIPFRDLGGMVADWSRLDRLTLVLESRGADAEEGSLYLDEIRLLRAGDE